MDEYIQQLQDDVIRLYKENSVLRMQASCLILRVHYYEAVLNEGIASTTLEELPSNVVPFRNLNKGK
jgi:hypothetical protein